MRALIAAAAALILTFAAALVIAFTVPAPPAARVMQLAPRAAVPGLVWHSGSLTVRLTGERCWFKEYAAELEEEGIPPARTYIVSKDGKAAAVGCWVPDVGGDILTRSPSGQAGTIPLDWFRSEPAT